MPPLRPRPCRRADVRRRSFTRWVRTSLVSAVILALTAAAPAAAADTDDDGGLGISVTVIAPPAGATTPVTARPTTSSPSAASAPSAVNTSGGGSAPAATDVEVAAGLFLSDISGVSRPTLNPFDGTSELWITLRNRSTETFDLTADFSLATLFGARIHGEKVTVTALKPGETRVVGTTLHGSGQWPFVVGRVVVDPPDTIAGQATAPVARAAMIWVVPWMLVILLVLGGVVFSLDRLGVVLARTSAAEGAAA